MFKKSSMKQTYDEVNCLQNTKLTAHKKRCKTISPQNEARFVCSKCTMHWLLFFLTFCSQHLKIFFLSFCQFFWHTESRQTGRIPTVRGAGAGCLEGEGKTSTIVEKIIKNQSKALIQNRTSWKNRLSKGYVWVTKNNLQAPHTSCTHTGHKGKKTWLDTFEKYRILR